MGDNRKCPVVLLQIIGMILETGLVFSVIPQTACWLILVSMPLLHVYVTIIT